ncbi:MAG: hypothetical protein HC899_39105 [Leptolyngbyaceae cyanobacterium SM1_4_3]|nr:hypothetical protein [Leptolyngbyaceae cyanobacterium SM1_4_3]
MKFMHSIQSKRLTSSFFLYDQLGLVARTEKKKLLNSDYWYVTSTDQSSQSEKKFISDDAYTLNIVEIIEEPDIEEFVYDISVDETHRFITVQGILCHNTGGGNPLLYKDGDKNINHVVELAHSLGYEIGVITNTEKLSRHLKPENADKLSWVRVSLIKLDEGKNPEDYDFSGFPLSKLGFSYIIMMEQQLSQLRK